MDSGLSSDGPLRKTRALVIAPTRELAEQIHETAVMLGKKTKIRSTSIYGGVGKGPQLRAMRDGTEIIVACPGRLLDHINEGNVDLSNVEVLVLDEADRMCDMGFLPDIRRIIKKLPRQRQNLFFSATMPKEIRTLADEFLTKPKTVQIGIIAPAKTVSHALFPVNDGQKNRLLFEIMDRTETDRVLIFTRTKRRARFLAQRLEGKGYNAVALQGNMAQNRRQQAINGFKKGDFDVLVATDIAARGIDVAEISHVINFDMPDTVDAYTHRIGRTGRAHANGEAYTFTTAQDEPMIRQIERLLKSRIERRQLEGFEYNGPADNPSRAPKTGAPAANGQNGGQRGGGRNSNGRNSGGRNSNGQNSNSRRSNNRNANGNSSNSNSSNGRSSNGNNSSNNNSGNNNGNSRKPTNRNGSGNGSSEQSSSNSSNGRSGNGSNQSGKPKGGNSSANKEETFGKKSRYDALRRQRRKALKKTNHKD